jgi:hypothetical protein
MAPGMRLRSTIAGRQPPGTELDQKVGAAGQHLGEAAAGGQSGRGLLGARGGHSPVAAMRILGKATHERPERVLAYCAAAVEGERITRPT